jgi:glycosidase
VDVAALLFLGLLAGCVGTLRQKTAGPTSDFVAAWPRAVSYEVFVQSFADSDGDGIGDLAGLTSKLDYVRGLGVRSIWLMPIHPSPSYHKYDVTDYRAIHPDYGTMEDFETLLREAHAREIRVVIDLVVNHTARGHPWFQEAVADSTSTFRSFYLWSSAEEVEALTADNRRWRSAPGDEQLYYGYFTGGMPDLNYDNPAVRDSIFAIGRFWLEKGVDGFRLDAARHIFEDGREPDNHAWWEQFRAEMESVKPEVLLLGEVWAEPEVVTPYLSGLHSLFNFEMAGAIVEAVRTGRGAGLAARHAEIREAYQAVAPDFVDATFLTNHDQNRVMSVLDDPSGARIAASLLFTLPGSPYLYYGEEIGMRGMKPDPNIREPFLWTAPPDQDRTSWIEPQHSADRVVRPMELQARSDTSLLAHYQNLIALRNGHPALTMGGLEPLEAGDERLVAFVRTHAAGSLLVLHNVSGDPVNAVLPAAQRDFERVLYRSHSAAAARGETLFLPPHGTLVLRP